MSSTLAPQHRTRPAAATASAGPAAGRGRGPRVCVFGCAPNTTNLGVSALFQSLMVGIFRVVPTAEVSVFDFGHGRRSGTLVIDGRSFDYTRLGANRSRRLYSASSQWNIAWSARLGGVGNPAARAILAADIVLDLSAGDSFTDLYGPTRFESILFPKRLALAKGRPLVLLPQTYGPYRSDRARAAAARVVRGAAAAWARDEISFDCLKDLLGDAFDPARHRVGVDLAFALAPAEPRAPLPEPVRTWLAADFAARPTPVVGVNVSGLIYRAEPDAIRRDYGFRADYRALIHGLLRHVLDRTDARLVLVPHVLAPASSPESDAVACEQAARAVGGGADRVAVLPCDYRADEIKHVIGRFDFFCGTRMHSTVAALGGGVPAAAVAYSGKTRGVFASCGVGENVVDPRVLGTEEAVAALVRLWDGRAATAAKLRSCVPGVVRAAADQIASILEPVLEPVLV